MKTISKFFILLSILILPNIGVAQIYQWQQPVIAPIDIELFRANKVGSVEFLAQLNNLLLQCEMNESEVKKAINQVEGEETILKNNKKVLSAKQKYLANEKGILELNLKNREQEQKLIKSERKALAKDKTLDSAAKSAKNQTLDSRENESRQARTKAEANYNDILSQITTAENTKIENDRREVEVKNRKKELSTLMDDVKIKEKQLKNEIKLATSEVKAETAK